MNDSWTSTKKFVRLIMIKLALSFCRLLLCVFSWNNVELIETEHQSDSCGLSWSGVSLSHSDCQAEITLELHYTSQLIRNFHSQASKISLQSTLSRVSLSQSSLFEQFGGHTVIRNILTIIQLVTLIRTLSIVCQSLGINWKEQVLDLSQCWLWLVSATWTFYETGEIIINIYSCP